MKKRILSLALSMLLVLTMLPVPARAADYPIVGNWGDGRWQLTNEGVLIIEGSGRMTNYDPEPFSDSDAGRPPWYRYRNEIVEVTLGYSNITHIGSYAFANLPYLQTVWLPDNLVSIGSYAFSCSGTELVSFTFPSTLSSIATGAFWKADLGILRFLGSEPVIGSGAFSETNPQFEISHYRNWNTSTLNSLPGRWRYFDDPPATEPPHTHNYDSAVTAPTCTTGGYTTHTCSSCGHSYTDSETPAAGHDWDTGTVTTAPTQTSEGVRTFHCRNCTATDTEVIPMLEPAPTDPPATEPPVTQPPVTSGICGENATWNVENGILTISGTGAIQDCDTWDITPWADCYQEITSVVVEEGITRIGAYAFYDFNRLISVELPASLQVIGYAAFYECDLLETIEIPENVRTMEALVFGSQNSYTGRLGTVTFLGDAPTSFHEDTFGNATPEVYVYSHRNWPHAAIEPFLYLDWYIVMLEEPPVTEPPVTEPPATEPDLPSILGEWTTDLVMPAADLGVSAPDSVLRATLTFGEDGIVSCSWEAVDLTAFKIFFHDMFVNAYYAMAYGAGITDLAQIEQFCMESTGMNVSDYMDTLVTDEAMIQAFTPAATNGSYGCYYDSMVIRTTLAIMGVHANHRVETPFSIIGDTIYLNANAWDKPDYTFVCIRK